MKVSPEIDELMWTVANSGDFNAIENFRKQYPELHDELSKRALLVRDLKKAKCLPLANPARPAFAPRAHVRNNGTSAVVATLLISTVAVIGIVALMRNSSGIGRENKPAVAKGTQFHIENAVGIAQPRDFPIVESPSLPPPHPEAVPPADSSTGPVGIYEGNPVTKPLPLPSGESHPISKTPHVSLRQVPLATVITALASAYKLNLKPSPGLANPTIDFDEQGENGVELLKSLGQKYGFGILDEGKEGIMLLPLANTAEN